MRTYTSLHVQNRAHACFIFGRFFRADARESRPFGVPAGRARHGFGTQSWPDGARYEGQWSRNQAPGAARARRFGGLTSGGPRDLVLRELIFPHACFSRVICSQTPVSMLLRPISLLRLSLLGFLDKLSGRFLMDMRNLPTRTDSDGTRQTLSRPCVPSRHPAIRFARARLDAV